jgi:nucleotide-binding universal stress UspA family protein
MKKIVVGTDFGDGANETVEVAARLAAATGADLYVLNAMASPMLVNPSLMAVEVLPATAMDDLNGAVDGQLAATLARLRELGLEITVETHRRVGSAADALCRFAEEIGADVIVVGNRRMKGSGRLLGSVAARVSHHAPCHVFIAHSS